ncbi:MAG: type II secretion system F family protein [Planctomycetota bacterium]|jgi:type II secretory pathway component PulF
MKLAYKAVDHAGSVVNDSIEALTVADASERLRQRGLYVTSIAEQPVTSSNGAQEEAPRRLKIRRLKNITLLSRQLSVLVRTGTPLAQALDAIERQLAPGPWRDVMSDIHRKIEEGTTLSAAMGEHDDYFDPVCTSLVAAGESSGQLDEMLDRLSRLTRQQLKIRRSLTSALMYPALLACVGMTVVTVMLVFVLPRFGDLFRTLDAPLPPTTQVLISISNLFKSHWWALAIAAAAAAVGVWAVMWTGAGRRAWDTLAVRAPYLGHVTRSLLTARLARLLGVLLESQVPLLEALKLTRHSTGNRLYGTLVEEAEAAVTSGEPLSSVFVGSALISPSLAEALRHGEQSGQVAPVLLDMADFMDEENEVIVRTMARLLEPVMLIVLGLVVGLIALSIFLPLFDLTAIAQGG